MNEKNRTQQAPAASISRRTWIGIAAGGAAAALAGERWWRRGNPAAVAADAIPVTVYASPTCGCCHEWVRHLQENNFHVTVEKLTDITPIKRQFAVPQALWSCHTAKAHAYAFEGHVPADLVRRLLSERLEIAGLAVPGMPAGSPGMEGSGRDRYEVIAFTAQGATSTYAVR